MQRRRLHAHAECTGGRESCLRAILQPGSAILARVVWGKRHGPEFQVHATASKVRHYRGVRSYGERRRGAVGRRREQGLSMAGQRYAQFKIELQTSRVWA